jgi:NO-binding membrane sensor protein with MHYT domain
MGVPKKYSFLSSLDMAEGIFGVHFLSLLLFKTYLKIYEPLLLCIAFVVKMFFFFNFGFDVEKKGITLESHVPSVLL